MKLIDNNTFKILVVVTLLVITMSMLYYFVARPIYKDIEQSHVEGCRAELSKSSEEVYGDELKPELFDYRWKCAELLDGKGIEY